MKKGNILFVRGDTWVSKIIQKLDGEYSHVAIALDNDMVFESQRFANCHIKKNDFVDYDVVDLKGLDVTNLEKSVSKLVGRKYDYLQIFYLILHKLFNISRKNNTTRYICSEVIAVCLHDMNYISEDELSCLVKSTPNELYQYLKQRERE